MNMIGIICLVIIVVLAIFVLSKLSNINSRIDDLYNKAFTMQGDIEENRARINAHYADMAQLNADIEKVANKVSELHNHEPNDSPAKEVEAELEHLIKEKEEDEEENTLSELDQRRIDYTKYRKQGMGIKEAGIAVKVSYTTAKRYEQWRQSNKK